MSGLGWQDAVVAVCVLLAAAWLVRRWVRRRRRATPFCEDCPGCAPEPPPAERRPTLVQLSGLERRDS